MPTIGWQPGTCLKLDQQTHFPSTTRQFPSLLIPKRLTQTAAKRAEAKALGRGSCRATFGTGPTWLGRKGEKGGSEVHST